MGHYLRDLKFSRATLVLDAMAGLTVALVSIPSGMAYAMVAGVNPVYGLYTGMVSTIVASLTVSSSLMVVTLTNALALVTADQLGALGSDVDPVRAMFTLTLLTATFVFDMDAVQPEFQLSLLQESGLLLVGIDPKTHQALVWSGREEAAVVAADLISLIDRNERGTK